MWYIKVPSDSCFNVIIFLWAFYIHLRHAENYAGNYLPAFGFSLKKILIISQELLIIAISGYNNKNGF